MTDTATRNWIDRTALDPSGDKIGTIEDIYVDDDTGQPTWLAVSTGLFGTKVSFVPLEGATARGDDIVVGYEKSLIKDAPRAEPDGRLEPAEEAELYAHYGRSYGDYGATDYTATETTRRDERATTGRDVSGPETDDAMTRSEEEIDVRTRSQEAGRARLRKWIETEDVHMTVPVQREKAKLVTEPITDRNIDQAMSGGDLTDEEHEVVLREEVVDVDKKVVPKERVRLETERESDEVVVDDAVRKERIEMDQDATTERGRGRR